MCHSIYSYVYYLQVPFHYGGCLQTHSYYEMSSPYTMTGIVHCVEKLLLSLIDDARITQVKFPVRLDGTGSGTLNTADQVPLGVDVTSSSNIVLLVGVIKENVTFQPIGTLAEQVKLRSSFPVVFTFTLGWVAGRAIYIHRRKCPKVVTKQSINRTHIDYK